MNINEFIKKIENYYGRYRPVVKHEVARYLQSVDSEIFPRMYNEMLLSFSSRYNTVPDVAEMERVKKYLRDELRPVNYFTKALPDPEARDYSDELGPKLKALVRKLKMGKVKQTDKQIREVLHYD